MKKNILKVSALAVIAATVLGISSCGDKKQQTGEDGLSGEISLSGAFALYPLAVQWANDFQALHPGVTIDVSAGGAGKGITDALAQVVDFGMVSRELGEAEIANGAVGFAVAKDAVVPTINANNPVLDDLLKHGVTRDMLISLFITGKTKTWGEVVETGDKTPVSVYTRSDACGAAETWALYLGKKQEDLLGTAVFGDPGLAEAVQKDVNAIGLNNIGFAYDIKTGKTHPGLLVAPIDVNENGQIDPEEDFYATKQGVVEAIKDGRYPSPPARDLYFVSKGVPTNPVVVEFLKYILTEGQKANEAQGYIAIPQEKLDASLAKLGVKK
ncbi:MAG: PstS family phosphate ABC transporter substrate-binding protein [Bacteroidaceae bacterium]|nr:PstS family phosphate ABC transporter substrate-binding protein [Bacteroidaceae bacterium]